MTTIHSPSSMIQVNGARVHNLKNVSVEIPRDALVVISGVSGSGKSSLAFDTIFAEGQRRYLESLSLYTRQFLNQLARPDVDFIDGLPPTIAVQQRTGHLHPRSTLGTVTEILDYLRLLYARAGTPHCPNCGREVSRQSSQRIVEQILALGDRRKVMILAPLVQGRRGTHREIFEKIAREGFVRARVNGEICDANEPPELSPTDEHTIEVIIDRIVVKEGIESRLQESVDHALQLGEDTCLLCWEKEKSDTKQWEERLYSSRFACPDCELSFPNLEPRHFSFNSPYGACPECEGLGTIPENPNEKNSPTLICPECLGARLQPFPRQVTFVGMTLPEFTALTITAAENFLETARTHLAAAPEPDLQQPVPLQEAKPVVDLLLPELLNRLKFLCRVGADYLSLDRSAKSLSGGEYQRARLASCLGAGLLGVCYVLDEPTTGLHPQDTTRLLETLFELRDQGNSVLIVEHDAEIMQTADFLIDLGPGAGSEGGTVVASGTPLDLIKNSAKFPDSPTVQYLSEQSKVPQREPRDTGSTPKLKLTGASLHNLKNVTLEVPLQVLTCVTGVSGSGKSSLISRTLVPALKAKLAGEPIPKDLCKSLTGMSTLERLVEVDQSPIGRSSRSTPATYCGIWDEIRKLFSKTKQSRARGYKARRFSFNAKDGQCPQCRGYGEEKLDMQFLPELAVVCPACEGARFNPQTLGITYKGLTIAEVLELRVEDAITFFENFPHIHTVLETLSRVGLGYLTLGQSAVTLSGGEAQRLKLATELATNTNLPTQQPTLFVLDEPTTGLHPHDVRRLLSLLQELVEVGHTVLVIEHQTDIMRDADWLIDMGPEGGTGGGEITATGSPQKFLTEFQTPTALALQGISDSV